MENNVANKNEILRPAIYWPALKARARDLEFAIRQVESQLTDRNPGKVYTSVSNGVVQYYFKDEKNASNRKGKYIQVGKLEEIKQAVQGEYNQKVKKQLAKELRAIKSLLKCEGSLEEVFAHMSAGKKKLTESIMLSDEDFEKSWLAVEYEVKDFGENYPEFYTQRGLRVRSKSEIIIASVLDKLHIPYRYEFPVLIKGRLFHPDFYCLNLRTRQEFLWEHFGMMDNLEYSSKAFEKLAEQWLVEKSGL